MAKDLEALWYFNTEEDFSGRELKLERKVDLASYNDYETIAKSPDWIDWTDSESLEFDFLARRILKVYADKFILQASEYGISRYEKILGIEPGEASLEERRKRVYLLWNKKIRWTHRTLLKWMDAAVGNGNYEVELLYNDYEIIFELKIQKAIFDIPWLEKELRKIIPANLLMSFRLYILDGLILKDKTDTYTSPFYPVGKIHKCGTIFKHQYTGKKVNSNIKIPNGTAVRGQRTWSVNEPKTGHTRGGKR